TELRVAMDLPAVAFGSGDEGRRPVGEAFKHSSVAVEQKLSRQRAAKFNLITYGDTDKTGHKTDSWHYVGQALDVDGSHENLMKFFHAFERLAKGDRGVIELFYDPAGGYNDGKRTGPIGGHSNHLHIAVAKPPGKTKF